MGEPAFKLPQEDKSSIRPDLPGLRAMEGGGEGDGVPRGNLSSVKDDAAGAGLYNQSGDSKADSVKDAMASKLKSVVGRLAPQKKALVGGGLGGGVLALVFFAFTTLSGPFEFIHFAKLLEGAHLASQQDQSDFRLSKVFRGLDYVKNRSVARTRLGYIGNKRAVKIEARFEAAGLKSQYSTPFEIHNGFAIDRTSPAYKNKSETQIRQEVKEKFGFELKSGPNGALYTSPVDSGGVFDIKGYFKQKSALRSVLRDAGYSKISAYAQTRVISKKYGLPLHPLRRLDVKVKATVAERYKQWKENRDAQLKGDTEAGLRTAAETEKDPKATPEQKAAASTAAENQGAADSLLGEAPGAASDPAALDALSTSSRFSPGKLAVGGAAALVGIGCLAKSVNDGYSEIKQTQVVLPLMRAGVRIVALGGEAMYGSSDPTLLEQFGNESKVLYNPETKTSWSSAQGIQTIEGNPNKGVGPDSIVKSITDGVPFPLLNDNGIRQSLDAACSTAGTILLTTFGLITGPVSTTVGLAVGYVLGPPLIRTIVGYLAGKAVNLDNKDVAGATFGTYADVGTVLYKNAHGAGTAGIPQTPEAVAELDNMESQVQRSDFQNHNLAYKVFNPYDRSSLLSGLIDKTTPSATQNVATLLGSITHLGSYLSRAASAIVAPRTLAATAVAPLTYGLPQYGFSAAELDDPSVNNPFANADAAATTLEIPCVINNLPHHPCGQDYIDKANACFGVNLTKTTVSTGDVWDVQSDEKPLALYGDQYKEYHCGDNRTLDNNHTLDNWLSVRMFIYDTQTTKGIACYEGDEQSCSDMGLSDSNAGTGTTPTTPSSSPGAGTFGGDSSALTCTAGSDAGIGDGYDNGKLYKIRLCTVQGVTVNAQIAANTDKLMTAAKGAGFNIGGGGFRTMASQIAARTANGCPDVYNSSSGSCRVPTARPGYSNHQMGLAIDFTLDGQTICFPHPSAECSGNSLFNWLQKSAATFGLKNFPSEAWHWSVDGT